MGILEKGTDVVTVFPSVETTDGYGNPSRVPSSEGVQRVGVFMLQLPGSEDASDGQSARRRFRYIDPGLELEALEGFDAYAAVEWNGTRLEVAGTPVFRRFPARLAHTSVSLVER